ncbi:hypothetical protein P153DRAFT_295461 [Dothidotthia symphoricarpi CBS 119687]|uniref:Uncharacterized protein n=1 Tax=Dothidotthia symphoricarpi CBS 119687 TaxID=1392245 RepID=A0A6A6A5G8_9PLEO|nr:uncharacterized protein P153DRAFT_295461 [Dothidotthia symphoricarpi CBS 119687]KAF2127139.1 hypothetical protein P153DRAFT_295461 [Dothidotthia symphoricarpi CBS 119687]
MFQNRWVTGLDQDTSAIWHRLEPAFRLASRFLTEDYCLLWFSHLTFGERTYRTSPSPGTWVQTTSYSVSAPAIAQVKVNLQELGEVITFMFSPRASTCEVYGVTYLHKSMMPWFKSYRPQDWPTTHEKYRSPRYRHARPSISMNADFQKYFKNNYSTSILAEQYRAWFSFAATIVHEIGHAYEFWLHNAQYGDEPFCSRYDKNAELGFSWETSVIGRITNPMNNLIHDGIKQLFSIKVEEYTTSSERERAFRILNIYTGAPYAPINPTAHGQRAWPLLGPGQFRGKEFFFANDGREDVKFVARIQAIPLEWVVNWFQEAEWSNRRRLWERESCHTTPPIGESFTIMYERYGSGAQVQRQLNLNIAADAHIYQQQWAQGSI